MDSRVKILNIATQLLIMLVEWPQIIISRNHHVCDNHNIILYLWVFLQTNEALLVLDDCDDDFNLDSEVQAGVTTGINVYLPVLHIYTYTCFSFLCFKLFRVSDTAVNILLKFLSMFFLSAERSVIATCQLHFCLTRQSLLCTKNF